MRKISRFEDNQLHWNREWAESQGDPDAFSDPDLYPIRYAGLVMDDTAAHTLDLGCGLGRVLKHYHHSGFRVSGIDLSPVAVQRLLEENPDLDVRSGDVRDLPFDDARFDTVLAFAVFHNLETGMSAALAEMARVMKPGGRFCVSMFPDNLKARFKDFRARRKLGPANGAAPRFRSWLLNKSEFQNMMAQHGLITSSVVYGRDFPLLWRFPWLRKGGDGQDAQGGPRRMNLPGRLLDRLIMGLVPYQACNSMIFLGHKATDRDVD